MILCQCRTEIQPWAELIKHLGPRIESRLREVQNLRAQLDENDPNYPSDSLEEILKVLNGLRRSFLQDVPFLMQRYPGHPVWNHPLFTSNETRGLFEKWKHAVFKHCEEAHKKAMAGVDLPAQLATATAHQGSAIQATQTQLEQTVIMGLHEVRQDLTKLRQEMRWGRIGSDLGDAFGRAVAPQLDALAALGAAASSTSPHPIAGPIPVDAPVPCTPAAPVADAGRGRHPGSR